MKVERVLVIQSGKFNIGVFLDHYMVTFCPRGKSILQYLRQALEVHVEASRELGVEPFSGLKKAPKNYQESWESAREEPGFVFPVPSLGVSLNGRYKVIGNA